MNSGFDSYKDILDVVAIPVGVGALAVVWPLIEAGYRRSRFHRLARRELTELAPWPKEASLGSWKKHARTSYVHRAIVLAPSENRDFLLSLNPSFVYYLTQLWAAFENDQPSQWLHYLERLSTWGFARRYREKIAAVHLEWKTLLDAYARIQSQRP